MTDLPLISEAGIYQLPSEVYHGDPAPEPSMSAETVNLLIDKCPAKAWANHPRLNPDFKPKYSRLFDIGVGAHMMQLEPEIFDENVVIVKADDWRTDWASSERRRARNEGKTALLLRDYEMILGMRQAIRRNKLVWRAFEDGKAERSVFAKDPTGIWRRTRPDLYAYHAGWMADYKTLESANPEDFGKPAWNYGWHRRAAWYLKTFQLYTGKRPDRYFFLCQEKEPPYLVTVIDIEKIDIEAGEEDCQEAIKVFKRCLLQGTELECWPGYRGKDTPDVDAHFTVGLPDFARWSIALKQEERIKMREAVDRYHRPLEG